MISPCHHRTVNLLWQSQARSSIRQQIPILGSIIATGRNCRRGEWMEPTHVGHGTAAPSLGKAIYERKGAAFVRELESLRIFALCHG